MALHLKIDDLISRRGCIVETVRFCEQEILLPIPTRTAGNEAHEGNGLGEESYCRCQPGDVEARHNGFLL